ncbi:MAG: hypothetical protein JWP89_1285 [Schlesneria sp.]|nr:hypothetical protein [Schlesneria sp.]
MTDATVLRARRVLAVYLVFSLIVTAFELWSFVQPDLKSIVVPFTGWTGLMPYAWTLYFAYFAMRHTNRYLFTPLLWMLGTATILLAVDTAVKGIEHWSGSPDYGNPYLTYHPARPLITVVVPLTWLLILWMVGRQLPDEPLPNCSASAS